MTKTFNYRNFGTIERTRMRVYVHDDFALVNSPWKICLFESDCCLCLLLLLVIPRCPGVIIRYNVVFIATTHLWCRSPSRHQIRTVAVQHSHTPNRVSSTVDSVINHTCYTP
jgi:hypothetical protein